MSNKTNHENAVNLLIDATNKLRGIKTEQFLLKKGSKQNFNLFSAIVSGKHNREHIEMYHSNILSYLLNPNGTHDCDTFFLEYFLRLLSTKRHFISFPDSKVISKFKAERERSIPSGRSIDISLEVNNEWIIFIENKVYSGELHNQFKDYCLFATKQFKNKIAVYLTRDGSSPASVKNDPELHSSCNIITLSYYDVIHWLEECCKDNKLIYTPHIISSIVQYINSLKKMLNIMDNQEREEAIKYFTNNPEKTLALYDNVDEIKDLVSETLKRIRSEFLFQLVNALKNEFSEQCNWEFEMEVESSGISYSFFFNKNHEPIKFQIGQHFPKLSDGGQGIWYGFYDQHEIAIQLDLQYNSWQSLEYDYDGETLSDFKNDTKRSSHILFANREFGWSGIITNSIEKILRVFKDNESELVIDVCKIE